ncbi:MAG: hypothetical protein AB1599_01325 [Planctomycetota bacterium]
MLKRQLPLVVAFIMGVLFIVQYFIPHQVSQDFLTYVTNWIRIIVSISLLLGIYSLLHFHYTSISRGSAGWGFSIVIFITFLAALCAGFGPSIINWLSPLPQPAPADLPWYRITGVKEASPLMWVFNHGIVPFSATMFSMIGFFIASAAFRAFRARSLEATLLLLAGVIIMLGQTPLGGMISNIIPDGMVWILTIPNMAAKRAILFGIAMGSIAFSLRIIFGIERAYLGGGKD